MENGYYKILKSEFDSFNSNAKAMELLRGQIMDNYSDALDDNQDELSCWVRIEAPFSTQHMTEQERIKILSIEDAIAAGMVIDEVAP